jgi:hypothetical protein
MVFFPLFSGVSHYTPTRYTMSNAIEKRLNFNIYAACVLASGACSSIVCIRNRYFFTDNYFHRNAGKYE